MSNKIDSNLTGLRYADEESLGKLPAANVVWKLLDPNSYGDFGGSTSTTARNTLNASRQRKKGVVTGKDSKGAFELDLTLDNMYDLLQGFMFADWRKKGMTTPTAVTAAAYTAATGGKFAAGDLVFGSGFGVAANNGVHPVTAASGASITATGLAVEANPPATSKVTRVGFQFAAGDAAITVAAGVVSLTAVAKDLTQLGLIPGEWVFLGGDGAANKFDAVTNKGFCRVGSVNPNAVVFDKTSNDFVADNGAGKSIQLFLGDVVKNESDPSLIKQRSYQLERSLSTAGFEYVEGAVANELSIKLASENKVTVNLGFVGTNSTTAEEGNEKEGSRPSIRTSDVAFNTSSDFSRLRLAEADNTGLASFLQEATVDIKNGVAPMKALGVMGAADVTLGDFAVSASVTAYFNSIAAVEACNNNADASLDFALVTRSQGMLFDIPLLSLGASKLQVAKDAPVKLPLSVDGAAHATLDHTLLIGFYAHLPALAEE